MYMSSQIDPIEFGELRGQVGAIQKTLDQHTAILEKLDLKLDGLVTHTEFEKHLEWGEEIINNHETRIIALENSDLADQRSFWTKLKQLLENKFANIVVNLLWLLLAGAFVAYLLSNYSFVRQPSVEEINETVKEITK